MVSTMIQTATNLVSKLGQAIDNNTTTKEEKLLILERMNNALMNIQKHTLTQELNGNALQRNWRPVMMYMFCYIIFHSILVAPILQYYLGIPQPVVPMDKIWNILQVSISGYVIGRTGEKVLPKVMPKMTKIAQSAWENRRERRNAKRNERKN